MPELVCLGRVGAAKGLKGEVRIRAFTARARDIAAYGPLSDKSGTRSFAVTVVAETGDGVVARLSGIADRTAAERIKGLELFVPRAALPELPAGEFYHADLLGLAAEDTEGRFLGRVAACHDFGAGAILEIEEIEETGTEGGKGRSERGLASRGTRTTLWPAGMIALVDLGAGKMVLEGREEIAAASESSRRLYNGGGDSPAAAREEPRRKSRKGGSA